MSGQDASNIASQENEYLSFLRGVSVKLTAIPKDGRMYKYEKCVESDGEKSWGPIMRNAV